MAKTMLNLLFGIRIVFMSGAVYLTLTTNSDAELGTVWMIVAVLWICLFVFTLESLIRQVNRIF